MSLRFCSFSSGSSGNCYLVRSESSVLLVDVGINAVKLTGALQKAGVALGEVDGILITHEHSDHVSGLSAAANRMPQARIWASGGSFDALENPVSYDSRERFDVGDSFRVGDIDVVTFPLNHDAAEPAGFSLSHEGRTISIVTDTGLFTPEILRETADADLFVIEANHDLNLLKTGRYPWSLKSRIMGEYGHLSNIQAARAVLELMGMDRKPRCVLLAHLSRDNNSPALAEQTVSSYLAEDEIYPGRDLFLKALRRDRVSVMFEI
jgi:phosphoribosyl 1,2-cyclic phosphodiesterase